MDDQSQYHKNSPNKSSNPDQAAAEPVRSRWTPKPEQILILESIFNSGMVNPPKEDTVRIRKLLEKFGAVGDANVFYWFQNRRSRSRRRQRQLQAAGSAASQVGSSISQEQASSSSYYSAPPPNYSSYSSPSSSSLYGFVSDDRIDDLYSVPQNPFEFSSDAPQLQYQPGAITVFINGVLTEVPRGAFDLRAMFGQNVVLVHSSGELVPVNEFGVLLQSLQMGESYFLVSST